jgi:hypothetical protein
MVVSRPIATGATRRVSAPSSTASSRAPSWTITRSFELRSAAERAVSPAALSRADRYMLNRAAPPAGAATAAGTTSPQAVSERSATTAGRRGAGADGLGAAVAAGLAAGLAPGLAPLCPAAAGRGLAAGFPPTAAGTPAGRSAAVTFTTGTTGTVGRRVGRFESCANAAPALRATARAARRPASGRREGVTRRTARAGWGDGVECSMLPTR